MVGVWLEARGLTRVLGRREVVRDLSFRAESGQIWAVLGSNGSGKSTLLKLLAGLLRPTRGESELGVGNRSMKGPDRRVALGLVSPEISPYEELTGIENLEFTARMRGLDLGTKDFQAALDRLGIGAAAKRASGRYSSGMKQRLKLAMAVQHAPAVLLLDEPTALLDHEGRAMVREVVEEQLRRGLVMWATNEPSELPQGCHEIRLSS